MAIRRRLEFIIVAFVIIVLVSKMYLYVSTNKGEKPIMEIDISPNIQTRVKIKHTNKKIVSKEVIDMYKDDRIENLQNKLTVQHSQRTTKMPIQKINLSKSLSNPPNFKNDTVIKVVHADPGLVRLQNIIASRKIKSILRSSMVRDYRNSLFLNNVSGLSGFRKEVGHFTTVKRPCPNVPPNLVGFQDVNFTLSQTVTMRAIENAHPDVENGGHWRPPDCVARSKVAFIVPFRDRYHHLEIMLHHLIPLWKRQQIEYRVFLLEQYGNDSFNKGRVMNAGFLEACKIDDFNCFIFHDVDMVSINDRNMYTCPDMPRHMSVLVDELENEYPVYGMVGGVFSIQTDHYRLVNGYSNRYWGWGAEDDDMGFRVQNRGLRIVRPASSIARYRMIPHKKRYSLNSKKMFGYLRNQRGFTRDGLNSIHYKIMGHFIHPLYTHFIVDIS